MKGKEKVLGIINFINIKVWLALSLMVVVQAIVAQSTTLIGRVTDAANQQPLEFATVHFANSNTATLTDSAGAFALTSKSPETAVEVSVLGYKTKTILISSIKNRNEVSVELVPAAFQLSEVLIKPGKRKKREIDTAALYLLRQVQEHKADNNPKGIPGYYLHEHNKLIISLLNVPGKFVNGKFIRPFRFFFDAPDTTASGKKFYPLLIQEEYNETYHRAAPMLHRKVIYYRKISGLPKNGIANLIANQFDVIDIYENVYIIAGKSFTSPFSPAAQLTYAYHIIDTVRQGNDVSYTLHFVAKNKATVAIKGVAVIDSATWGIRSVNFKPNENANVNFLTDYTIQQTFEHFANRWLLKEETISSIGNLLEKQKMLSVYITKHTARNSITADFIIPDSVSRANDNIFVKGIYKQKRAFIDSTRISPLNAAEEHIYQAFDSAKSVPAYRRLKWAGHLLTSGYMQAGPIEFGKLQEVVSRNAVEGYRLKLVMRTNEIMTDKVWLYSHVAYGFSDKKWKYELNAHFMLPAKYDRWHALSISNKNDMILLGQENPLLGFDNVLTILSPNKLNRVIRTSVKAITYERDWFKGLSSTINFNHTEYYSSPGNYTFQRELANGSFLQIPQFGTNELSADLRYCKTEQYLEKYGTRLFIPSKAPSFTFRYSLGFKGLFHGNYNYHKFEFQLRHVWQMPVVGYAYVNLKAGYMLGQVPYTSAFISSSNRGIIKDDLSFQLTKPFEFVNDKYVQFWYEHHFEGLLFNQIPYIKKLKLREFISVKALWGGYSKSNQKLLELLPETHFASAMPYVEVGFGVENILKIFQLHFVWRATYRDTPGAQNFGIKLGIKPSF